jgi:hypothetical protein
MTGRASVDVPRRIEVGMPWHVSMTGRASVDVSGFWLGFWLRFWFRLRFWFGPATFDHP